MYPLIQNGANISIKDNEGKTALDLRGSDNDHGIFDNLNIEK